MKQRSGEAGKLRSKPIRHYRWIVVVEAALVTLAAHAALFYLTRYRPESRVESPLGEAAITYLGPQSLTNDGWRLFDRWIAVHDPALFSRTDNSSGFAALCEEPQFARSSAPVERPAFVASAIPRIPDFSPLKPLEEKRRDPIADFFRPPAETVPPAAPLPPQILDDQNRLLTLRHLSRPLDRGAALPTVVRCRRIGGLIRQSLLRSCGDAELDATALQALARSGKELPETTLLTIYWPENGRRR